jgi:hypothetical protein
MQIKVKAETGLTEDKSAYLRPSPPFRIFYQVFVPFVACRKSLLKTDQNRTKRGGQKRTVVHQQLTTFKTERPVSFLDQSVSVGGSSLRRPPYRYLVHAKMVLLRRNTPEVKMRRLAISNLRCEKWHSTIFSF